MKILCEDTLLYGTEFFADVADFRRFSATAITPDLLRDVDALFVRSTTKVTSSLLAEAKQLKLVATATSGSDHFDWHYLQRNNIAGYAAGGCNAIAVAEYVIAGILHLVKKYALPLAGKRIGIVGAGYVGTALAQRAEHLGLEVLLCDPPLQDAGDPRAFVTLDEVMRCEFISLHVPLITEGRWPTHHLFNSARLETLKPQQVLINACRGEVVDNVALKHILQQSRAFYSIFDVWENEPEIDFELSKLTEIASQHIAGHTLEGKARGTEMVYNHAAKMFGWPQKSMWEYLPSGSEKPIDLDLIASNASDDSDTLQAVVSRVYDIKKDSQAFVDNVNNGEQFRYSRKNYAIRREFASEQVKTGNSAATKALYGLGFASDVKNKRG